MLGKENSYSTHGKYPLSPLISGILFPVGVLFERAFRNGEDAAFLIESCRGEAFLVESVLALEGAKAYHVVTSPVLIEELTASLFQDFGK